MLNALMILMENNLIINSLSGWPRGRLLAPDVCIYFFFYSFVLSNARGWKF